MVLNKKIDKFIDNINHSKIFAGLALLMLNVGSKHIDISLSPAQEAIFKNRKPSVIFHTGLPHFQSSLIHSY